MTPLTITKQMLNLPILREGEVYPYISDLPRRQTLCEALKQAQLDRRSLRMMNAVCYELNPDEQACWQEAVTHKHKLRVLFVVERSERERMFVKGGFLYDTPEQFAHWQEGQ